MSSIFTKIINGELPSYKIYEDEKTSAFLDIFPDTLGHVLVVPKNEIDKVYDLDDEDWATLWMTVKKIAKNMERKLNKRILIKVIGTDVAHAHVHLIPFDETWKPGRQIRVAKEELVEMQDKLALL